MTLVREGWTWSGGRKGEILREPSGELVKVVCLACDGELEDIACFERHECHNYRPPPRPERVEATDAAIELERSEGVALSDVEGTGQDGRIVKSDITHALDYEE